jgi:hypothetical protein
MSKFLHWRKMTWALVFWSAAMATWLVMGGLGVAIVVLVWLVGAAGMVLLWFMTQPLVRQGRGFGNGFFVRPGPGHWKVLNLHRVF